MKTSFSTGARDTRDPSGDPYAQSTADQPKHSSSLTHQKLGLRDVEVISCAVGDDTSRTEFGLAMELGAQK